MKSISPLFIFVLLIVLTSSLVAQVVWTKYEENPVFPHGESGTWDENLYPFCILFQDATYHEWYGGFDGTTARIGYASSPDGIIWTPLENPVLDVGEAGGWEDERVLYPYVLLDGDTFHMWYTGWNGSNTRIGYATSTDKVTWTKYAGNPVMNEGPAGSWDDVEVFDPCVHFDGDTYHMWYGGNDGSITRIGYASSPDGITWTKYTGNPVLKGEVLDWDRHNRAPDVFFDGTTYHMWYTGTTTLFGRYWQIGYATSPDGITWTKYAANPVLTPSDGSWESQWVGFSRVLWDGMGTQFKMWYGGGSDDVVAKGGYATAPDSIPPSGLYDKFSIKSPEKFVLIQNYPNPFNPSTTIKFQIPNSKFTTLKVYNILGEEVANLLSAFLLSGSYTYTWDASNQASGVYYYQLVAGDYSDVKKMIFLR